MEVNPLGDPEGPSVDYTAVDQFNGNVINWATHFRTEPDAGNATGESDELDESDTEMGNDAHQDRQRSPSSLSSPDEDEDMVDGDKICYGMLHAKDVVLKNPNIMTILATLTELSGSDTQHVQKFTLTLKPAPHILLSLPDGTQFGILRHDMTDALEPLLKQCPPFELEAVAITKSLRERIAMAAKPNEAVVQVSINIYGPASQAKAVGDKLSDKQQWLQKPDYFKDKYPYSNPHTLEFPDLDAQMVEEEVRKDLSTTAKPRAAEERIHRIVSAVQQGSTRAANLNAAAGDQRLKTELLESQQQALQYMWERETGNTPDKYKLWKKELFGGQEMFVHRITKTRSPIQPEESGGGVLADEMGMGKTLATLARILQTLEEGKEWAEKKRSEEHTNSKVQRHTHSTLVVVPSALLINHWMKEIRDHTGDAFIVIKHHGQARYRNADGLDELEKSDIVITTYNTLATEFSSKKGFSILHKIFWYRIVLDEAHMIRRQATSFYRACADLEAKSRWCLTGTPIQNRLEDIGALFAFLKAEPFHNLGNFRKFICIPSEAEETVARDRLILLYDSLVLRRTKDILKLPQPEEKVRPLTFTDEERRQYLKTTNILNRYVRTQVNHYHDGTTHGYDPRKPTKFGLFQAQLQQRILCNHGTWQKPFSWKRQNPHEDEMAMKEAWVSEVGLRSELTCDGCRQPRPILGSSQVQSRFDCKKHSLCLECLEDCIDMHQCPLCQRFKKTTDGEMRNGEAETARNGDRNQHHKDYFNPTGTSTKMKALMKDVKKELYTTKSIIFSCWTRTLDLVGKHLRLENVAFERVDGETLVSKRQGMIDKFANDTEVRVLLMTTGTGAFGLNLTAASRIFIVEPQWNPSVENQAIARAIRLGQKEIVKVKRYLMLDTVEKQMQDQQTRKRQHAEFGFSRRDDEEDEVEGDGDSTPTADSVSNGSDSEDEDMDDMPVDPQLC
ncbi:SNF2 family N-terminal domain-containing protein [Echria macrotheca]|uniref:SNF2 family N-terminal domain-containing protein n=1 Tax=Echria macrotheca TaxID=438768 RepID=A0AAJ0F9L8_9PEZI|nr:SNF2 family N-terminal domain-containing protein [Echria macrotheca]